MQYQRNVERPTTPCWPWCRAQDEHGRGKALHKGVAGSAHRMVYERLVEPIPAGFHLDHLCRNPLCVNPDHMEPVPPVINSHRRVDLKLSMEKATRIRAEHDRGVPKRLLAVEYGVTEEAIRLVIKGKTWKPEPVTS